MRPVSSSARRLSGAGHLQTAGSPETGPFPPKALSKAWAACINPPRDLYPAEKRVATKKNGHWRVTGSLAEETASCLDEVLRLPARREHKNTSNRERALLVGEGRLHVMGRDEPEQNKVGHDNVERDKDIPWVEIDHSPQSALRRMETFARRVECTGRLEKLKEKLRAVL